MDKHVNVTVKPMGEGFQVHHCLGLDHPTTLLKGNSYDYMKNRYTE